MTGTMRTTTETAHPAILRGQRAGFTEIFVAGPGTSVPGSFAYRSAAGTARPTRKKTSSAFGVPGKWEDLDCFSFSLDPGDSPPRPRRTQRRAQTGVKMGHCGRATSLIAAPRFSRSQTSALREPPINLQATLLVPILLGVDLRFYLDPTTGQPYIWGHNVEEKEVEEVLANPGEDRLGGDGSRVAIGQTARGRYLTGC